MSKFFIILFSNRFRNSSVTLPILCIILDLSIQVSWSTFAFDGNLSNFPVLISYFCIRSCVEYNFKELEIGTTKTV